MRNRLLTLLIAAILTLTWCGTIFADTYYYDYYKQVEIILGDKDAKINGTTKVMDQPAFIKDGRTLVPFRFLGEALGATVEWNSKTKQAMMELGKKKVIVTMGSKSATVNGEVKTLDVAPVITGGRTFIPLRFVSEELGAFVDYEDSLKQIMVRYVDRSKWIQSDDGPYYPSDWTLTRDINDIPCFNSPNGSKLWIYSMPDGLDETIAALKQSQKEEFDYTLVSEEPISPDNPELGVILIFNKPSDKANVDYVDYLTVMPGYDGTDIYDMKVHETDIDMDWAVMYEISFGLEL